MTSTPLPADIAEVAADIARTPQFLYKYVAEDGKRLAWLTANISNSTLYFSTRDELNDPFEFGGIPSFDATPQEVRAWCAQHINPSGYGHQDYTERIEELVEATRDPDQAAYEARKFLQVQDETTAILSLSEVPDSLAMWSYYADGHRGVSLILETSLETIASFSEQPVPYPVRVSYRAKMPVYQFFAVSEREFTKVTIGTKMQAMKEEREWRLVQPISNPTLKGLRAVPPQMICGVILGARITANVRSRVVGACRRAQFPILLYEAILGRDRYGLRIQEAS